MRERDRETLRERYQEESAFLFIIPSVACEWGRRCINRNLLRILIVGNHSRSQGEENESR